MLNLKAASLEWALRHAVRGDTDIFPPIFEFGAIEALWQRPGKGATNLIRASNRKS